VVGDEELGWTVVVGEDGLVVGLTVVDDDVLG
jgi:hypothetical protein